MPLWQASLNCLGPSGSPAFSQKGVGCKYLCTWYSTLHEVFEGPRDSMCDCVCVHVSGPYTEALPALCTQLWAASQVGRTHDYYLPPFLPPPSSVSEQVSSPRLATDTCACWASVGACWKGKCWGQGLLGLVLRGPVGVIERLSFSGRLPQASPA